MNKIKTQPIGRLTDLLPLIDLDEILTYKLSANRCESVVEPSTEMTAKILHTPETLGLRLKHTLVNSEARFVVDLVATYRLQKPIDIRPEVVQEFMETIAFLALVPYLREGVATMAAKLGVPVPLLKIVRQGQFSFATNDGSLPKRQRRQPVDEPVE